MLTISGNQFLWNGEPFRILSGSMHYFRVVPQYWADRIQKMRTFGLNTVETYIPWNLHESEPTEYNFKGSLDLATFLATIRDAGMHAIVRPGPYICSEFDFGGLPYWLLKDRNMQIRCSYAPYLEAVERYFDHLMPILAPFQTSQGGPIMAMQLENEYGSFGNDLAYLSALYEMIIQKGMKTLLFTSDPPTDGNLQGGTLQGVLPAINFAYDAPQKIQKLREYKPGGPLFVSEFWSGWFDHWGEEHHTGPDGGVPMDRSVEALDHIMTSGASINFYMFHGGTNFGFMNGANDDGGVYRATVTSYDYDAPLTEWGDPSPRFMAYREVLSRHIQLPPLEAVPGGRRQTIGKLTMSESVSLWDVLEDLCRSRQSVSPGTMEDYDQDYGFILYRTYISGPRENIRLKVHGVRDRAQVYLDGDLIAIFERERNEDEILTEIPDGGSWLDILVENMGRVNFGTGLMDRKGILDGVTVDGQFLFQWQIYPLSMKYISPYLFQPAAGQAIRFPMFFRSEFDLSNTSDTFLDVSNWTKGVAWVNGVNIGRFWNRGPQKRLYIPGPLLRQGRNDLILLELHEAMKNEVSLVDEPDLGARKGSI